MKKLGVIYFGLVLFLFQLCATSARKYSDGRPQTLTDRTSSYIVNPNFELPALSTVGATTKADPVLAYWDSAGTPSLITKLASGNVGFFPPQGGILAQTLAGTLVADKSYLVEFEYSISALKPWLGLDVFMTYQTASGVISKRLISSGVF